MRILYDPGHGGRDRANRGPTGYVEADGVLLIAQYAATASGLYGAEVRLTRDQDIDLAPPNAQYSPAADLSARTRLANTWPADLLVSVHTNAMGAAGRAQTTAVGTETYVQQANVKSISAGVAIQAALVTGLGTYDRGVRTRDLDNGRIYQLGHDPDVDVDFYHILREARVPAVIVEVDFHDHPEREKWLNDINNLRRAGDAIAAGVHAWGSAERLLVPRGPFLDVPPDHWTAGELAAAKELGIEGGRPDGRLGFGEPISYEAAVALAMRTYRAAVRTVTELERRLQK